MKLNNRDYFAFREQSTVLSLVDFEVKVYGGICELPFVQGYAKNRVVCKQTAPRTGVFCMVDRLTLKLDPRVYVHLIFKRESYRFIYRKLLTTLFSELQLRGAICNTI